jgi:hypothetical protein
MADRLLTIHLPQEAALVADLLRQVDTVCCDHNLTALVEVAGDGVVVTTEPQETTHD